MNVDQDCHFSEIELTRPDLSELGKVYERLADDIQRADGGERLALLLEEWDRLRSGFLTWLCWTTLRFRQQTDDSMRKQEKDVADMLRPRFVAMNDEIRAAFLAREEEVESIAGSHAVRLWKMDASAFEPSIEGLLVEENRLAGRYTSLLASAAIVFDGRELNLTGLAKFAEDVDPAKRRAAHEARWNWFAGVGDELDQTFDELVATRTEAARKLDLPDFVELGYRRMGRTDFSRDDVEGFREVVQEVVVPLAQQLRRRQRRDLGVDTLMAWDEPMHDPSGNPAPTGDGLAVRAATMFDRIDGRLSVFFRMLSARGCMDLQMRNGKAGGGFCTSLPDFQVPFIFANCNGTKGDVRVFTHEVGHAFQNWMSRDNRPIDLIWPTSESAEIHSMSLEFLTWPQMELFFEDADSFRRIHLTESLLFIPYGVAVDHFQHLVYERPDATPLERHQMWKEMESLYLPWRDFGETAYPAAGGYWQGQRHIYCSPFYYIDYVLASLCSLQFLNLMRADYDDAIERYVALCKRGGSAPFSELVRSAGLRSPFDPGCVKDVLDTASEMLEELSSQN
jgi:M3 family oligoendopeptidase